MITLNSFSKLLPATENDLLTNSKIISLDVFDTLIFRKIDPDAVINSVATWLERCNSNGLTAECSGLDAYHQAYQRAWTENVALGYDQEVFAQQLFEYWVLLVFPQLTANEIQITSQLLIERYLYQEKLACYRNSAILPFLDAAAEANKRIIYISDMYLPKKVIDGILAHADLLHYFSQGYVSSEYALLKRTGRLFDHVCTTEHINPDSMLHIGDHPLADGEMASKSGLHSIYVNDKQAMAKRRSKQFDWRYLHRDRRWLGYIIADAASSAVYADHMTKEEAYAYRVLGPMFATFIHSVLERCKQENIKKVFFLAREGLLLKQLFEQLALTVFAKQEAPEATYLYVSRLTAFYLSANEYNLYEFACTATNGQETVSNLLSPLKINKENLGKIATKYGIPDIDALLPGGYANYPPFQNLIHDPHIRQIIIDQHQSDGMLLQEYLEQLGFFADDKIAIVDVGWGGQIQNSLYRGLTHRPDGCPKIYGFYFGINGWAHSRATPDNQFEGLLSDQLKPNWAAMTALFFPHAFEAIVRSPHGTTTGYVRNSDQTIMPVFKDSSTASRQAEIQNEPLIAMLQKGIEAYAQEYTNWALMLNACAQDTKPYALEMIERMIRFPSSTEARMFFAINNISDLGSEQCCTLDGQNEPDKKVNYANLKRALNLSFWQHGILAIHAPRFFLWFWILRNDVRHIPASSYVPVGIWNNRIDAVNTTLNCHEPSALEKQKTIAVELEKQWWNISKQNYHSAVTGKQKGTVKVSTSPLAFTEILESRLLYHVARPMIKLINRDHIAHSGLPLYPFYKRMLAQMFDPSATPRCPKVLTKLFLTPKKIIELLLNQD